MRLGELIAVARECKGWTLRDLEKVSGVSNALISQIETGKVNNPRFSTVVALIDALGISLDRAATGIRMAMAQRRVKMNPCVAEVMGGERCKTRCMMPKDCSAPPPTRREP